VPEVTGALAVADWRRQVFGLYAKVREVSAADPQQAHTIWRTHRDALFATHPASPLLPAEREGFAGLRIADYDPAWRFEVAIQRAHDSIVLDFNFTYNPSCAYDPAWACPLAPADNVVGVEIPVGEQ
jgi:uncharacterized protein (DUF1684 family)